MEMVGRRPCARMPPSADTKDLLGHALMSPLPLGEGEGEGL
jgi:hypothetical protein